MLLICLTFLSWSLVVHWLLWIPLSSYSETLLLYQGWDSRPQDHRTHSWSFYLVIESFPLSLNLGLCEGLRQEINLKEETVLTSSVTAFQRCSRGKESIAVVWACSHGCDVSLSPRLWSELVLIVWCELVLTHPSWSWGLHVFYFWGRLLITLTAELSYDSRLIYSFSDLAFDPKACWRSLTSQPEVIVTHHRLRAVQNLLGLKTLREGRGKKNSQGTLSSRDSCWSREIWDFSQWRSVYLASIRS